MAPPALVELDFVAHHHDHQQSPRSPATVPRELESEKKCVDSIPSLCLSSSSNSDGGKPLSFASLQKCKQKHARYSDEFVKLQERVTRLVEFSKNSESTNETDSLVLQACAVSLRTRLPLVLRQTAQLIENAESGIVGKMRSTLALVRTTQYVDSIQEGMDPESNEGLDEQLRAVLEGLDVESLPEDVRLNLAFRVSPWIASSALCFDLPLGGSATWQSPLQAKQQQQHQLPIRVQVEPVVEFRAHDMASVASARAAARACAVTIESCAHEARAVCTGAGMIGEAVVRVHVRPIRSKTGQKLQVWGSGEEVPSLCIKEARA